MRVFTEPFFGKGRACDAISHKLRGALEMLLDWEEYQIPYEQVPPQSWKDALGLHGRAEKEEVKDAVQRILGWSFPEKFFVQGKWRESKKKSYDIYDATAIALSGITTRHPLVFADSFRVFYTGPPTREGHRLETQPLPLATLPTH